MNADFGIVGGYGATGKVVAAELLKRGDARILVAGRDLKKAQSLAAEIGGRVAAARVDARDDKSLDDFCARCRIIVNCAGPVSELQDRAAQAAFRRGCHYLDPAGMSLVKERMAPHAKEITDAGLSFVISAGWMPGLSECLPIHAFVQAKTKMDSSESVKVYFGDSGDWSDSAMLDGARYLRKRGLRNPGYFTRGEWTRAKSSVAFSNVDLGDPIGVRRFGLFATGELNELGASLKDCDFYPYTYVSGLRAIVSSTVLALLPLPERTAIGMVRNVFRSNRLPVAGFVVVHVLGETEGRRIVLKSRITFPSGRDYWIHGVTMATVARFIAEGKGVQPGVHFLADGVDPIALIEALKKAGVEQTEEIGPANDL